MTPKTMNKLKTLKDLEDYNFVIDNSLFIEQLRQEAIKWIKELRRTTGTNGQIDYRLSFKEFFNITEDGLK
jgi:hypothetical protein